MVTVKYDDLSMAFDFVSSGAPTENRAYVSLDTGAIHWISESNPIEEDELPDDLETSERYIEIPHKYDLDLGNSLALRFVEERLPLLAAEGCLEKWYAFEAESTERALRDWCKANEIHVAENGGQQSA